MVRLLPAWIIGLATAWAAMPTLGRADDPAILDRGIAWAKSSLGMPDLEAVQVGRMLSAFPEADTRSLEGIVGFRLTPLSMLPAPGSSATSDADRAKFIADELAKITKGLPINNALEGAIATESARAQNFASAFQAYSKNNSSIGSALAVAHVAEKYPREVQRNLLGAISTRISIAGTDPAQIAATLADFERKFPPNLPRLPNAIDEEYSRADAYLKNVTWLQTKARLVRSDAVAGARFFDKYPSEVQDSLANALAERMKVWGVDPSEVSRYFTSIERIYPPGRELPWLKTQLAEENRRAAIYANEYAWARDKAKASEENSRMIAKILESTPDDRLSSLDASLQRAVAQQGTDKAALLQTLSDLTRATAWKLDASGKKIEGCQETTQVDSSAGKALPLQTCLDDLPVTYTWIDPKTQSCGAFTAGKLLIKSVGPEFCSDTLAQDLRPCLSTLSHSYRFYQYETLESVMQGLPAGTNPKDAIQNHVQTYAKFGWENHAAQNGLGTAIEPISTAIATNQVGSDGKNYLYRIEIPAGATYFDATTKNCSFTAESLKTLAAAGCPNLSATTYLSSPLNPLPPESCQALLRKTFRGLKIRGWANSARVSPVGDCGAQPSVSFSWNDVTDLPKENTRIFTNQAPEAGSPAREEAVEIERLFEDAGVSHWPELAREAQSGRSTNSIAAQTLLGCENLRSGSAVRFDPACDPVQTGVEGLQKSIRELQKVVPAAPAAPLKRVAVKKKTDGGN